MLYNSKIWFIFTSWCASNVSGKTEILKACIYNIVDKYFEGWLAMIVESWSDLW